MLHNQLDIQCLLLIAASGLNEARDAASELKSMLSKREHEVLAHLARGKTAKQIGLQLDISRRTVEHHIQNIKYKTNCNSRSEIINMYWGVMKSA
jgi:DNA-binding CsgD family transcriptional regulator